MLATYLSPLADHLWQSTIFAIAAGLLAFALRKNRARTRYWIWLIASMKFFVPFSLLISLGNQLNSQTGQAVYFAPATGVLIDQVAQPFGSNQLATVPIRVPQPRPGRFSDWLPAVVFALWMCGSGMLILRWFKKWWTVRTARTASDAVIAGKGIRPSRGFCANLRRAKTHRNSAIDGCNRAIGIRYFQCNSRMAGTAFRPS